MTLLATPTFYYLCEFGHRFHRKKPDLTICYRCGGKVKLYGLADDTRYADDRDEAEATGVSSQEKGDRRP